MHDRRRDSRRSVDMVLNAYQDGLPGIAFADNISVSGMRLRRVLEPRLRRAETMELEFQLPYDREVIYVTGERVYQDESLGLIGIRFVDLTEDQFEKVARFVEGAPSIKHLN